MRITVTAEVCERDHGGPHNEATVYGHFGSTLTCVRIAGSDTWVNDVRSPVMPEAAGGVIQVPHGQGVAVGDALIADAHALLSPPINEWHEPEAEPRTEWISTCGHYDPMLGPCVCGDAANHQPGGKFHQGES